MWVIRSIVASRIGGIQDRITHGVDALLVDDRHLERYVDLLLSLAV